MVKNESAKERFFRSCIIGDLNTITTDLFYSVSPFVQDMVWKKNYLILTAF